ncbi:MAG: HEAT repeat domain-containing protein [Armatimonadota bacterium]
MGDAADRDPPRVLLRRVGRRAVGDPYLRRFLIDLSIGRTVLPPRWAASALLAWARADPEPVVRLLRSGSATGPAVAAEALGLDWPRFQALLQAASCESLTATRMAAVTGLAAASHRGSLDATDTLIRMLRDRDSQVRWSAARHLGEARGAACMQRAAAAFTEMVNGDDERALVGAVFGLAELWPVWRRQSALLLQQATRRSPLARRAVASAAELLAQRAGLRLALSLAEDSDPEVRAQTATTFARWATSSRQARRALAKLARDATPLVRAAAAAVLPVGDGVRELTGQLAIDRSPAVRAALASGLQRLPVGESVGLLRTLTSDTAPAVRAAAVESLAKACDETMIREALRDPHPIVRAAAAGALKSPSTEGAESLSRLTGDRDPLVAAAATRALGGHLEVAAGPLWEHLVSLCQQQALALTAAEAAGRVLSRDGQAGPAILWSWPASPVTPLVLARIAQTATSWRIAEPARTLSSVLDPERDFAEAADDAALAFASAREQAIAETLLWLSRLTQTPALENAQEIRPPACRSRAAEALAQGWQAALRAALSRRAPDRSRLLARADALVGAVLDTSPGTVEELCLQRAAAVLRNILHEQSVGDDGPGLVAALRSRSVLMPGGSVTIHLRNASERLLSEVRVALDAGESGAALPVLYPGESRELEALCSSAGKGRARVLGRAVWSVEGRSAGTEFEGTVKLLRPRPLGQIENPFVVGKPLGGSSAMFFGREAEIEFIERSVSAGHGPVVVLVGHRRTGKTSLLQQAAARLARSHRLALIDLQGIQAADTDGFLRELARPLLPQQDALSDGSGPVSSGADMVREAVSATDQGVVLLLDEFDELERRTREGTLDSQVLAQLRHLIQHQPGVRVVLSGTHRLEEVGGDLSSFLLNLAIYRRVGGLSREESERVLGEPLARLGIVCEDSAVAAGARLTGGHPYLLQLLGYRIVERCVGTGEGGVWVRSVQEAAREVVDQGDIHLRYLWDSAGEDGQPIVRRLAEADRSLGVDELRRCTGLSDARLNRALERLVGLDLVSRSADRAWLRLELLGRWLRLATAG